MSPANMNTFRPSWFGVLNAAALTAVGLLMFYPFWHVLVLSLSPATEATRSTLLLWPASPTIEAYLSLLRDPDIVTGFINSTVRTVLGTALSVVVCALAGYAVAQKRLPFRRAILLFLVVSMVLKGGLVSYYMLMRSVGLLNSMLVLVLPMAASAFSIIILKNFFQSIPESYAESARMDGASELAILVYIYLPLSLPVLSTVALWTAVMHWNSWFDGLVFITEDSRQVLQIFLQRIVIENNTRAIEAGMRNASVGGLSRETIKAATVVITVIPMLLLYVFVQKHFVKGIQIGGIKE